MNLDDAWEEDELEEFDLDKDDMEEGIHLAWWDDERDKSPKRRKKLKKSSKKEKKEKAKKEMKELK